MSKLIHGAGGGLGGGGNQKPPKQRQPKVTQDSAGLRTISFAKMQFLLCEGPIAGPAVGLEQSTYVDSTPVRSTSGAGITPEDLVLSYGKGPTEQTSVPGYGSFSSIIAVDKAVKYGLPVTQQITASDSTVAYSARILLTWEGLVRQDLTKNSSGDVTPYDCNHGVTYTDNLGVQRGPGTILMYDKFGGPFQREYELALEGPGPWTVRVERYQIDDDTADNATGNSHRSSFSFSSIVLTASIGLRYPHSSVLTMGVRADQYSDIPAIAVDLLGKIIRVPSNYDPATRVYNGLWDGTFKDAYSNNPAWVLYDLITHDRYGLGQYVDKQLVDKWTLYEIAKYCDQPVPDLKGSTEPRFTCNLILQTAEEAWTVLQQFSSIFRGIIYYASSTVITVQDCPKEFVYTFNESNTIEQFEENGEVSQGNFTYAGSAKRARHTAVLVSWDDPADNYQPRVEYVADQDAIVKLGYRALQLRLMGVTSRGQAIRAANWALLSEQLLDDTVSFSTGAIGATIRPGDLIRIADPNKAAIRMGGRILAVNNDGTITVDQAPQNPPGGWAGATFSFMAADDDGQPVLRTNPVQEPVGDVLTVGWTTADRPQAGWPWLIEVPGRTAQQFRVLTVSEDTESGTYSLTALRYRKDLYDAVDFGSPLSPDGNDLWKPGAIDPPVWTVAQTIWDGGQAKLDLAWKPPASDTILGDFNLTVRSYRLQYLIGNKQPDGTIFWPTVWKEVAQQFDNIEVLPMPNHTGSTVYKVRIAAVSRIGVQSGWAETQALTLEEWFPMPDLSVHGALSHQNLSTGGHVFSLQIPPNIPMPPYVSGKVLEAEEAGAWELIADSAIGEPDSWTFTTSAAGKPIRARLSTYVPGLEGKGYATDFVDRLEIVPPAPTNLRVVVEAGGQSRTGQRRFSWDLLPTPFAANWPQGVASDITAFDIRYRQDASPDWDRAFPLFSDGIPGDQRWFATKLFDSGTWTVMIRSRDRTGWLSDDMAIATVGIGDPIPSNVVQRYDLRDSGFQGTLVNLHREKVAGSGLLYKAPTADPIYTAPLDDEFYEGSSGYMLRQDDPSLDGVYTFQFECLNDLAQLVIFTTAVGTYRWHVQPGGRDLDLVYATPLGSAFYLPAGLMYPIPDSATSNGWHPYAANEEMTKGIHQLRLTIISDDEKTPAAVNDVDVVMDYPDVIWSVNDHALPAAGGRITFPAGTFRSLKAVSLTMQDDGTHPGVASNAVIRLKTASYIDVVPLDSAGAPAAGVVDVLAVGW